jgi:protein tyrosine phosphatase
MALTPFAFDPEDGLRDATEYPDPATEEILRAQVQDPSDQLKDYINGTLKTEVDDKEEKDIEYVTVTASRDLTADDLYKCILANHASVAIVLTMPAALTTKKAWIMVNQAGAAQASVAAGEGVTYKPADKLKVNGQDETLVLTHQGSDVWNVGGMKKA